MMSQLAKALQALLDSQKTANFVSSLKHSDLPTGWQNDDEIVSLAGNAYKEMGTDSPFFKAWGGNTKVVDDMGKPLEVYHGTGQNFDTFSKNTIGFDNELGKGFYFTNNKQLADNYASPIVQDNKNKIESLAYDKFESKGYTEDDFYGSDPDVIDDYNRMYDEAEQELFGNPNTISAFLNSLGDGTDGIIDNNFFNNHSRLEGIDENTFQYTVFEPTQIKSTSNRGTFDPADPNIYRALPYLFGGGVGAGALLGGNEEAEASTGQPQAQSSLDNALRALGIGTRDVLTGLGNFADYTVNPIANAVSYPFTGNTNTFSNQGTQLADYFNLPQAESEAEKNISAFNTFASEVLPTLGTGLAYQGTTKGGTALNAILQDLASKPKTQIATAGGLGVLLEQLLGGQ